MLEVHVQSNSVLIRVRCVVCSGLENQRHKGSFKACWARSDWGVGKVWLKLLIALPSRCHKPLSI